MSSSNPSNVTVVAHADMALAQRCATGDPGGFEELYRIHSPRLFGLACRMVGRTEAEDLLQEIFLSAHRKIRLYKGESALGTWLFRMATNLCLDHLRSRANRTAQATDSIDADPGHQPVGGRGPILGVIDRIDLERALADLPPGCREVFVLYDVEGFEHREVGSLLGISEGTSKSQLHKARMRLREALVSRRARREERPADPGGSKARVDPSWSKR
jgi:RNA polymerase sigma-70 factor (ECF subfamily)